MISNVPEDPASGYMDDEKMSSFEDECWRVGSATVDLYRSSHGTLNILPESTYPAAAEF